MSVDRRAFIAGLAAVFCGTALPQSAQAAASKTDKLKAELETQRNRGDHWRLKYLATKKVWSKADTRFVARKACRRYKLTKAQTDAFVRAVIDIIYDGARESSGDTHCTYGQHAGIVQFNRSWHINSYEKKLLKKYDKKHKRDWRKSGIVSIYRMVRSYRDGGMATLRRHWKATLNR